MGLKSGLTPLSELHQLDRANADKLRAISVTTVEDLAGLLRAEPILVQKMLEMDDSTFQALSDETWARLPPKTRQLLEQPVPQFGLGATGPNTSEDSH